MSAPPPLARLLFAGLLLPAAAAAQLGPYGNVLLTDSAPQHDAQFSDAQVFGDFDGDGAPDLAVGSPRYGIDGFDGRVLMFMNRDGVLQRGLYDGVIEGADGERLGAALASCDFNGNGRDELAVGVPGDSNFGGSQAGAVRVFELLGSGDSALWTEVQVLAQGDALSGSSAPGDRLGSALACGDFDDDGFADLAIGVPEKDIGLSNQNGGKVAVIYGRAQGLSAFTDEVWHQDSVVDGHAVLDQVEDNDRFGWSLAVGDFDRDGYDDLVIGSPYEDFLTTADSGAVNVLFGSADALAAARQRFFDIEEMQDEYGVGDISMPGDRFGWSLAVGDFNRGNFLVPTGYVDLAIGAPYKHRVTTGAGVVYVIPGGAADTALDDADMLIAGDSDHAAQSYEYFGFALAAGHFDRDLQADLAVGRPGRDFGSTQSAGIVTVFYGEPTTGLHGGAVSERLYASSAYASTPPGYVYGFGSSLASANVDGDRSDDLAIGIRDQLVGTVEQAGAVQMVFTRGLFADGFE